MKGIVTVDDIVDVVQEEATEDIQKAGGMQALEAPYLETRLRARWSASAPGGSRSCSSARCSPPPRWPLPGRDRARGGARALRPAHHLQRGQLRLPGLDARHPRHGAGRGAPARLVARHAPRAASGLVLGTILGVIGFFARPGWEAIFGTYGRTASLWRFTVAGSLLGVVLWGTLAGSDAALPLARLGSTRPARPPRSWPRWWT